MARRALAGAFDALNRHDLPKFMAAWRDDGVFVYFDLSGTNVVAVHWNIQLTNREGHVGQNSGVTVVNIKRGKVFLVKDFIFDLGDNFRRNWSAP